MIRENTEFPFDAILKEEATVPQSYADLADFRRSVREYECGGRAEGSLWIFNRVPISRLP